MIQKYFSCSLLILALLAISPGLALADLDDFTVSDSDGATINVAAGYRWVSTDDNPNRAAEYSYLDDSAFFKLFYDRDLGESYFSINTDFQNENDYRFDVNVNHKSLLRVDLRTERYYHNLDHIPYQDHPEARPSAESTLTNVVDVSDPDNPVPAEDRDITESYYSDQDPGADYNRRITTDEIKVRAKLPNYPAHLNVSYWHMEKKGKEQLRFVDENCAGACHMQSSTRRVDRVTDEITAGFDAHLGPVDIAFLQTLRELRVKEATPVDSFASHTLRYFGPARSLEHSALPESKMSESAFMINLPPSGGFTSSASFTIGKRENESDVAGVEPTDPESDYQKLTADVTYTPEEHWTFNFRYRMLDLDSDSITTQTSNGISSPANPFSFSGVPVRQSMDLDRDNYAATVAYRPSRMVTIKGDFEREEIQRTNTGLGQHNTFAGIDNPYWDLPQDETINRLRLSLFSRLLEKSALKINSWYQHKSVDNPAYSTTLNSSGEFFVNASYRPSAIWGVTSSLDILRGENDDHTVTQYDHNGAATPYDLDRDEERENLSLGLWFIPSERISADFNYGLLRSKIDQDVLFGAEPNPADPGGLEDYTILDDDADYEQKVHTLSAGVNLRVMENLSCRVEGYHIRSKAEFSPSGESRTLDFIDGDFVGEALAETSSLDEISELDIRQNGIKTRIRWAFSKTLSAGLEYTFDEYDDRNGNVFDGSAQTCMASLSGRF